MADDLNMEAHIRQRALRKRAMNWLVGLGAAAIVALIIWLDVATGFWSELVVLSGLAAGGVTFILTALVFNRILARRTELRWEPVTRLALTEFLHLIADENQSEVARGQIVPRSFREFDLADAPSLDQLESLRHQVVEERKLLTEVLGRWASFLAASGNCEGVLRHIASIALQLDELRDATIEAERSADPQAIADLNDSIARCNDSVSALQSELQRVLNEHEAIARAAQVLADDD